MAFNPKHHLATNLEALRLAFDLHREARTPTALEAERLRVHVLGKGKHTRRPIKFFAGCRHALEAYLAETVRWPLPPGRRDEPLFAGLKTHHIRYLVDK